MRLCALILAGAATTAPAAAQTFAEAVRTNVWVAIHLCESPARADIHAWAQAFRSAGFAERAEINAYDATYHFTAPADTVEVTIYAGQIPDECTITSRHMGVREASQLVDAAVPGLHPTYVRQPRVGAIDPAAGAAECTSWVDPANEIGAAISVRAVIADTASERCVENGTSVIYSSYRV